MSAGIISKNMEEAYNRCYTGTSNEWRTLGARYKTQNILDLCASLGTIDKILEVGAGEGSILNQLDNHQFGKELYALEISERGVEAIQKRGIYRLKEVKRFDGYHIPYEDDSFDLVILSHVLEHVEFPRLLLREMRRVSQFSVIEIPCDYSPRVDEKIDHLLSYGHINVYLPALLRFLLKSEGLTIISDKTSLMTKDVIEYIRFTHEGMKKTLASTLRMNLSIALRNLAFMTYSRQKKELKGNAYTVLCRKSKKHLTIFEPAD